MRLFIAQTIDGFIAGPGGSLDHLTAFNDTDYGYDSFIASADAVILGRNTFDAIYPKHGWAYPGRLPGAVLTSRALPANLPDNVIASDDIDDISTRFPNAFVDGGGQVIRALCDRNLIREARIFTLPILLGDGTRLFPTGAARLEPWTLLAVRRFANGAVMHHYAV